MTEVVPRRLPPQRRHPQFGAVECRPRLRAHPRRSGPGHPWVYSWAFFFQCLSRSSSSRSVCCSCGSQSVSDRLVDRSRCAGPGRDVGVGGSLRAHPSEASPRRCSWCSRSGCSVGRCSTLLVVFAQDVYDVGDGAYGLLAACLGAGAVLASPFVAGWGSRQRRSRHGHDRHGRLRMCPDRLSRTAPEPEWWVRWPCSSPAPAISGISSTLNTTVQLQVTEVMRGRVIALYIMSLDCGVPLGSADPGALIDVIGPQGDRGRCRRPSSWVCSLVLRYGFGLFTADGRSVGPRAYSGSARRGRLWPRRPRSTPPRAEALRRTVTPTFEVIRRVVVPAVPVGVVAEVGAAGGAGGRRGAPFDKVGRGTGRRRDRRPRALAACALRRECGPRRRSSACYGGSRGLGPGPSRGSTTPASTVAYPAAGCRRGRRSAGRRCAERGEAAGLQVETGWPTFPGAGAIRARPSVRSVRPLEHHPAAEQVGTQAALGDRHPLGQQRRGSARGTM